ncbi:hypothetical protein J0A67_10985 [Algoriphagus aestuariicola]|jgi:hypothetical protein|uniref:Uncharacterized protein n=1 Tax=Algoriphagus aestuariicola TaxID=1852016 RepID=A0ABS3BPZ4_9BACT|nr:hypothetical protein [Algoriphagus aestuariicola]MBN7801388.1 hypothetical protein [Algoriphagus aestuariicola]
MKADRMEKLIDEVVEKLEKLKETQLASDLKWCWGSFQSDQNSSGLEEKGTLALVALKNAREKNARSVAKKLVDDLEKALS